MKQKRVALANLKIDHSKSSFDLRDPEKKYNTDTSLANCILAEKGPIRKLSMNWQNLLSSQRVGQKISTPEVSRSAFEQDYDRNHPPRSIPKIAG